MPTTTHFHEQVIGTLFGSDAISNEQVTQKLVLGGLIFTVSSFLVTYFQPAAYGRYASQAPAYLKCKQD